MFGFSRDNKSIEDVRAAWAEDYKDFTLIDVTFIDDIKSVGLYLRHKKTGLEIFHIINDDEENLFAFTFRTPPKTSNGVAHIIEHSVLCGSQKFPLKEPFTNMLNQSVNTFLNAMTYSDKTVYPAASLIKKDYFNLMDVYADAVFFPLLKKEAFMQEAWRLEVDDNDQYQVQGVVYNEMKGCYNNFDDLVTELQMEKVFDGTCYAVDSGGDPNVIPTLTYEEYREFYERYYRPDNCLLFLYGNIPTKVQIDFLQGEVIPRLEKKYPVVPKHDSYPYISPLITAMQTHKGVDKPRRVKIDAPEVGALGCAVSMNWVCGESSDILAVMECSFLAIVLSLHDAAPITKALTLSKLGKDTATCNIVSSMKQFCITIGLYGVALHNEKKVYALIRKTLNDLCENGVDKDDIQATFMHFEITNREQPRHRGPFALRLLDQASNAWNYGVTPASHLKRNAVMDIIKQNLQDDPHYIEHLIKKYLLDNPNCTMVCVKPGKVFKSRFDKAQKALVKKLSHNVDLQMVKAELEILHEWQGRYEDETDLKCLPPLELKDLTKKREVVPIDIQNFAGPQGNVPLFYCEQNTNEVCYTEVWIPCDNLPVTNYKYLPLYVYSMFSCGTTNMDWMVQASKIACLTGGIFCRVVNHALGESENSKKAAKALAQYNVVGRDWIVLSLRSLASEIESNLEVLKENLCNYTFDDTQRLETLIKECHMAENVYGLSNPNVLANVRSRVAKGHTCYVDEIWRGTSQLLAINEIFKEDIAKVAKRFTAIKEALANNGAVIQYTTDVNSKQKVQKALQKFVIDANIKMPIKKVNFDDEALKKEVLFPNETSLLTDETLLLDTHVSYVSSTVDGASFASKEDAPSMVLSHYLCGTLLWEKIRTKGGAYGANATLQDAISKFVFYTYRDPNPDNSIKVFDECLKEVANTTLDEGALLRTVIGTYGEEITPQCPREKASMAFLYLIYCFTDKDFQDRMNNILKVTSADLQKAATTLLNNADSKKTVVVSSKNTNPNAFTLQLPQEK